ncbi:hypothetical protein DFH06DRAFT_1138393 [Mycena polygramma]|nr:hypothetical protein DFH06DRAFT_1138393 [Mycena polygramma]
MSDAEGVRVVVEPGRSVATARRLTKSSSGSQHAEAETLQALGSESRAREAFAGWEQTRFPTAPRMRWMALAAMKRVWQATLLVPLLAVHLQMPEAEMLRNHLVLHQESTFHPACPQKAVWITDTDIVWRTQGRPIRLSSVARLVQEHGMWSESVLAHASLAIGGRRGEEEAQMVAVRKAEWRHVFACPGFVCYPLELLDNPSPSPDKLLRRCPPLLSFVSGSVLRPTAQRQNRYPVLSLKVFGFSKVNTASSGEQNGTPVWSIVLLQSMRIARRFGPTSKFSRPASVRQIAAVDPARRHACAAILPESLSVGNALIFE